MIGRSGRFLRQNTIALLALFLALSGHDVRRFNRTDR